METDVSVFVMNWNIKRIIRKWGLKMWTEMSPVWLQWRRWLIFEFCDTELLSEQNNYELPPEEDTLCHEICSLLIFSIGITEKFK
jgi:hypothetical protein